MKNAILLSLLALIIITHFVHDNILRSNDIRDSTLEFSDIVWVKRMVNVSNCYVQHFELKLIITGCDAWKAGDELTISGKLTQQNASIQFGQKVLIKKIKVIIKKNEVSLKTRGADFLNFLSFSFYSRSQEVFSSLGVERGYLMFSLIFGQSFDLPSEMKQIFRLAGLPYIISVSSYSFSLTIESFFLLTKYFPYRKKVIEIGALISLSLYILVVGYPVALQRVVVALFIDYLSKRFFYRPILPLYRLVLSSLIILALNPFAFFDIGFQFPVLASAGLCLFSSPPNILVKLLPFSSKKLKRRVAKLIWLPISAQILLLPLILFYFGDLNLISPISTLLISWILPIILILGMSFWLIGQFFIPILPFLTPFIKGPIIVFLAEINLLAGLPFHLQYQPSLEVTALGYCLITLFIFGSHIYHKRYIRQSISYGFQN